MSGNRKKRTTITPDLRAKIIAELQENPHGLRAAKKFDISLGAIKKIADSEGVELRGRQLKGEVLSADRQAEIISELTVTANLRLTARKTGTSTHAVSKIAKLANIELASMGGRIGGVVDTQQIYQLLAKITGKMTAQTLDKYLGLKLGTIGYFTACPEIHTAQWITGNLVPRLLTAFPDKKQEIKVLEAITIPSHLSAAKIKNHVRTEQKDFRSAAGLLLRELRENCGQNIESVQQSLKLPILQKNLGRIETGDATLASSIYRDAIRELCATYKKIAPEKAAAYIPQLERIGTHLKR